MTDREPPVPPRPDPPGRAPRSAASSIAEVASLVAVLVVAAAFPFTLRVVNRLTPNAQARPSYIPAVQAPRQREPFNTEAVRAFREVNPAFVVIGDSMAGSRIHHRRLGQLIGQGVVPIFEPGTGSAYWYLGFKNWVLGSGIRPKAVVFFFRDENMTDPMFRLTPFLLDRVALDREPRLNEILAAHAQGPWFRVHGTLRDLYQFDRTRDWIDPVIARAPVPLAARPQARERLLVRVNQEIFTLDTLRPMAAADMAYGDPDKFDFRKNLPISVLPEVVSLAKQAGVRLGFVRVQRRPLDGGPPEQSPDLRQYVRDLRQYLKENGAHFHDEWGDPELPLSIYGDGDHISNEFRLHCTELLVRRNPELFR